MYKIGYNQGTTLENSTLKKDLEYCEYYGYDYIEIRFFDQLKEYLTSNSLDDLNKYFNENNIKPLSLNALFNINNRSVDGHKSMIKDFKEMLECAKTLNIEYIVAVASFINDIEAENKYTIKEIHDSTVKSLREISDIAEGSEVKIAFEFVGDPTCTVNTLGQAIRIVEDVDRKNVGYCIDTFHFHGMGSKLQDIDRVDMAKVYFVHIDDCEDYPIGFLRDPDRVWPGKGAIDLESILKKFKENNFNGTFSVELFRPEYYEMDPKEVIKTAYSTTKETLEKYY